MSGVTNGVASVVIPANAGIHFDLVVALAVAFAGRKSRRKDNSKMDPGVRRDDDQAREDFA
ncbi:hypothetical protein [Lysobacter tyrosinilyticus]